MEKPTTQSFNFRNSRHITDRLEMGRFVIVNIFNLNKNWYATQQEDANFVIYKTGIPSRDFGYVDGR